MKKMDLLKEIQTGRMSLEEAEDLFYKKILINNKDRRKLISLIGMTRQEYYAFMRHGAIINDLLIFRNNGWPQVCYTCKKPIIYKNYDWEVVHPGLKPHLIHNVCANNYFRKQSKVIKAVDLLKKLYFKNMTGEESELLLDEVVDNPYIDRNWDELFKLDKYEYHAAGTGSFKDIAYWRYNGWPKRCCLCNKKIYIENLDWIVCEHNNRPRLSHLTCP